jgi:hypothetical protein
MQRASPSLTSQFAGGSHAKSSHELGAGPVLPSSTPPSLATRRGPPR